MIEKEVYITRDGLGRAAIVQRKDGVIVIYTHWLWSERGRKEFNVQKGTLEQWSEYVGSLGELYDNVSPEPGLYGSLDDARLQINSLKGFAEYTLSQRTDESINNT